MVRNTNRDITAGPDLDSEAEVRSAVDRFSIAEVGRDLHRDSLARTHTAEGVVERGGQSLYETHAMKQLVPLIEYD